jgi:hypothetical protein
MSPSYQERIIKPAWGLYRGNTLIATVRADNKRRAWWIFQQAGFKCGLGQIRSL